MYNEIVNRTFQDKPPAIQQLLSKLKENTFVKNNILYKHINRKELIFPRLTSRTSIILRAHHSSVHGGFLKKNTELKNKYYWESFNFDIHNILYYCSNSQS